MQALWGGHRPGWARGGTRRSKSPGGGRSRGQEGAGPQKALEGQAGRPDQRTASGHGEAWTWIGETPESDQNQGLKEGSWPPGRLGRGREASPPRGEPQRRARSSTWSPCLWVSVTDTHFTQNTHADTLPGTVSRRCLKQHEIGQKVELLFTQPFLRRAVRITG